MLNNFNMIKLVNLLKEASNKKYSFSQLQDFVKLWHYSEDKKTLSSEEKNAIQVLVDIGFLRKTADFKKLGYIYTEPYPDNYEWNSYRTTDGKDFNDLSDYTRSLPTISKKQLSKKIQLNPRIERPESDPIKKKKGKFSFDYGNSLFADLNLDVADSTKLKKFLKKWYTTNEPNTEDENEFLKIGRAHV
mgnify:FL=1